MSNLIIPADYNSPLDLQSTEHAIKQIKDGFENGLSSELRLRRVTAPLFVLQGTGLNDDLNGIERAVSFPIRDMGDVRAEVVHSLAKWKRFILGEYGIAPGYGIYTDMNAIRSDEELDNIHSLYVDQWDWERVIMPEERNLGFLKNIVKKIYNVIKSVEYKIYESYPELIPSLPEDIGFIHSEELLDKYPDLSSKEREKRICREYGAVCIIGIGGKLSDGNPHDGRAPDYDDWTTETVNGFHGLNCDILLWNPVLEIALEISSMGIRVNKEALLHQLELRGALKKTELMFHKRLLNDELPLSIGGGIGQSRLCMHFLKKAHVGEIQASIWSEDMIKKCRANGICLM